eukprot:TRINITY_DN418_c0_g1_i2.p2 TRINITY_DN418_c0_g1~~TRINITY_DN418_c0_g1_i2.p2  ORF type:complete len:162 (-),score=47.35 TRINITY_DN418_c0_g1_i2:129-614(-)
MVAGLQGVGTILQSIHEGGASRLSGAYHVHTFPRLMNYMATQGIPVEISGTQKLRDHTKNATFAGSPIRLFIDNGIPLTLCSFRGRFSPLTRVEMLAQIVGDCQLTTGELLRLSEGGCRHNFGGHARATVLTDTFWARAKTILGDAGHTHLFAVNPFPKPL